MGNKRCREAAVWLAAQEAGSLEAAERIRLRGDENAEEIRLQEHLESCAACRRDARGIAGVVEMLREGTPQLAGARADRLWRAVQRGELPAGAPAAQPAGWRLPPWLWAGAGAFALTLVTLAVAGDAILGPPAAPGSPVARASSPLPPGWAFLDGNAGVSGELALGRALAVAPGGKLALRSEDELLTADGGTRLSVAGETLELHRGVLRLRNAPGRHCRLRVRVGQALITPLGTAFEVRRGASGPSVAVAHGSVRVSHPASPDITVRSGQRWSAGALRALDGVARHELARRLGLPPVIAHAPVAKRTTPEQRAPRSLVKPAPTARPKLTVGTSRRARRATRRALAAKSTKLEPKQPGVDLRAIERLLLAGKARQARRLAREALASGAPQRATLQTLVAESLVRERWYSQAAAAYLAAHRAGAKTTVGADALYLAGVLELEQLRRPALAKRRFSRYLSKYKRGRQRQGAHYMLVRALRAAGDRVAADAAVKRYRAEFPRGRYLSALGLN